jgi:carbamoyltransferase
MLVLGISAYYHDSAAALVKDGVILAAAQEERFSRIKHDESFPTQAIHYCLQSQNIDWRDIDYVCYYEKPFITFERILETFLTVAPRGWRLFHRAIPPWIKDKLFLKHQMQRELKSIFGESFPSHRILFTEHHQSHAASAYYPSPFDKAAILTMDGVGEWATTSISRAEGNEITLLKEIHFPHSLGLLYSAFTYFCGFKVNSGEYKLMGLAPYGSPRFADLIKDTLITLFSDGSFKLDLQYFNFHVGQTMTNKRFAKLFGIEARKPEAALEQIHMDLAASIQVVLEEAVLNLAIEAKKITDCDQLCLAGGVALNCVANGKLQASGLFSDIWIQPAAGDAGGALGAAMSTCYLLADIKKERSARDHMKGAYLGPEFSQDDIRKRLENLGAVFKEYSSLAELIDTSSELLSQGNYFGWFQGPMEFGPRALGNRSILGDPRSEKTQKDLNLKVKYRESFRPFAPSVLVEKSHDWFQYQGESPYMLLVSQVSDKISLKQDEQKQGMEKLYQKRSEIPAITHVDYSARLQTVHPDDNPSYHQLIDAFYHKTSCPLLVNTSFNVRGEPIVCTPEDAFQCFMGTDLDYLVVGNFLLDKKQQQVSKSIYYQNLLAD